MTAALSGLKVLDLTRVLAGPLCTMLLGDLGADIIKIESPSGDETRAWGPPFTGGEAAYFLGINRNKRSLILNLQDEQGRRILGDLIKGADILVENYKSGTLDRWGFGPEWREANVPRLIHCSITGYGPDGPRAADPGYDFILQAETGLMSITGQINDEPTKHGVAIVDITTGLLATIAILGALQARQITGRGQTVTASLFESGISLLANVAANFLVSGKAAGRYGNGHPNIVPYRTFATSDGQLALAVGNDAQFARFSKLCGHPEWMNDERMKTNAARVSNRDLVDENVRIAMALHGTIWWLDELKAAGIPTGKVNSVADALADPQTLARKMVMAIPHPTAGSINMLGFPFKMTGTPQAVRSAPPLLGQHADEILAELGYDESARAGLYARGVTGSMPSVERVSA